MTDDVATNIGTTPDNGYEKAEMLHGQHRNRFYWILGTFLIVVGMISGYFIGPDDWPLWRQLLAGGMFGIWCGYCVFAWHLLFYNTVEE